MTRTVLDAALLHEIIGGHDPLDSTSDRPAAARRSSTPPARAPTGDLTGVRIGVVTELGGEGYQAGVLARFQESVDLMVKAGAEVVEVSCPSFVHALATYYLILPAEASSQPRQVRRDALRPAGAARGHRGAERRGRHARHPRRRLRRRGEAPHHPRHLRAVERLLRRLLRPGPEGAHADHAATSRRRSSRPTCWSRRPRRPRRSSSARSSTTRWRCTSTTSPPSPPTSPACPGISVPSGLADEDGLPAGVQILAPALADDRVYRVGAAARGAAGEAVGRPAARPGPAALDTEERAR